jgi:hypothetical protein
MPVSRFTFLRFTALGLAAALLWIAHHDRWTWASWQVPTEYSADSLEMLMRIRAAEEGASVPLQRQVVTRLAAPFEAMMNDYPAPDKLLVLVLAQASRLWGLGVAANLALVVAQVLSVWSFYGCARVLRVRREWAAVGALLFAFAYASFARGLGHMLLVFNWTVPLGLLACAWIAARGPLRWRSPRAIVCLATAAALGVSNPYNLYFWLQLVGWAILAQAFRAGRRENLGVGGACIGVAFLTCALVHAETWLYPTDSGASELIERNYGGTEMYALKPIELLIPPSEHRWEALAFFGQRYLRWSDWRGEAVLPYLGLVGIAGLGWLAASAMIRALRGRSIPGPALQLSWLTAASAIGGVTNVLAFFLGLQVFRATNRVSVWLVAIVLIFLLRQVTRLTRGWSMAARLAGAGAVLGVGLLDQIPRPPDAEAVAATRAAFERDLTFGSTLERELGPGAMVFQLPVFDFPEVPDRHRLSGYEHARLYLATDTLRLSFGELKGRSTGEWQREMETLPPPELVRRLECYGFAALMVARAGYPDGVVELLRELADLGYSERWADDAEERIAIRLRPVAEPVLPLAGRLTLGEGWHRRPELGPDGRPVQWSFGSAVMNGFNPTQRPQPVAIQLAMAGASEREFELRLNGAVVHREFLATQLRDLNPIEVTLQPGSNRFDLVSSEPALRVHDGRNGLRALGVARAALEWSAAPACERGERARE